MHEPHVSSLMKRHTFEEYSYSARISLLRKTTGPKGLSRKMPT
jgi:hypothetical protein